MTTFKKTHSVVAFIDILGFKNMIQESTKNEHEVYSNWYHPLISGQKA